MQIISLQINISIWATAHLPLRNTEWFLILFFIAWQWKHSITQQPWKFEYLKHDSRLAAYGGTVLKWCEIFKVCMGKNGSQHHNSPENLFTRQTPPPHKSNQVKHGTGNNCAIAFYFLMVFIVSTTLPMLDYFILQVN